MDCSDFIFRRSTKLLRQAQVMTGEGAKYYVYVCCAKSRSGFQPDNPDGIGIYRKRENSL